MNEEQNNQEEEQFEEFLVDIDEELYNQILKNKEGSDLFSPEFGGEVLEKSIEYNQANKILLPSEKRKNFNTYTAGILAIGLWSLLGISFVWNMATVTYIGWRVLNETNSEQIETFMKKVDKSASMINDTSKSLYAVIAPMAATITAFYFNQKMKEDEQQK